jgi:predicted TPR repeat methyltransferase
LGEAGKRAAEFFRRFLEETPDEAEVRLEAAAANSELGDQAAAIEQTRKAVALRPEDRELRLRLARYQTFREETIGEAAETLDEMTEGFGPDAEVAALRGDVYRFQGDYVAANRAYRRSLEMNPDDPRAVAGMEAVEAIFQPEFFGGIGFTRDWSSDFDHWNMDLGVRNIFSAVEHRIDAQYRFLYYRQPVETQNPGLGSERTKDVTGNELNVSVGGPLRKPWSYIATLGGVFYDEVGSTAIGRLGLGYAGERLSGLFGIRRREAVFEHYDLSALIDEVRTNDLFGRVIYQTKGDDALERWQFEGYGETGYFSDSNYRSRVIASVLNRTIESEKQALKLGLRGLYLDYSKDSPNYFSPSDYYGGGVTGRYDYRLTESTDGGLTGTALWIEQVDEFDIAVGGYLDHQINDSSRASLRLDYGESTFPDGDIRSFSGRAEIQILF